MTRTTMAGAAAPQCAAHERVAAVTGAASGIGRAVTLGLAAAGFVVAAADLELEALERALGAAPAGRILPLVLDVTDPASVRGAAEQVERCLGRADVLVNSAGVFCASPALALDEASMWRLLDVNLCGTLRCMAAFGELMSLRRQGRIINIASIGGVLGAPLASVYAASKAGIIAASRSAARELASQGIVVNVVVPGFCDTPMLSPQRALVDRFVTPRIPLGRIATAEEVAEPVIFLATSRTSYITGSVLTVDGGLSVG